MSSTDLAVSFLCPPGQINCRTVDRSFGLISDKEQPSSRAPAEAMARMMVGRIADCHIWHSEIKVLAFVGIDCAAVRQPEDDCGGLVNSDHSSRLIGSRNQQGLAKTSCLTQKGQALGEPGLFVNK
jgi:hypothetical protein